MGDDEDILGTLVFDSVDNPGDRLELYIDRNQDVDEQLMDFWESLQVYLKTGEKG